MFPDSFFNAAFFNNAFFPPGPAGGGPTPPVEVGDYTFRAWSYGRHRVVN